MITAGIKKLIEGNALGLSSVDKYGKPHSIAVAYVKVVGDKIIITNCHIHETLRNLKINNNVALVVWNKDWEKVCVGFELKGKAKCYTSGKWFKFVKNMPDNEDYDVKGAIVVSVNKIKMLKS